MCRAYNIEYFLANLIVASLTDISPIRKGICSLGISELRQKRRRVLCFASLELDPQVLSFRRDNASSNLEQRRPALVLSNLQEWYVVQTDEDTPLQRF